MVRAIVELKVGQSDWLLLCNILLLTDGEDIFLFGFPALSYLPEGRSGKDRLCEDFKLRCVPRFSADIGKCFEAGGVTSLLSPFSTGYFQEGNILKRSGLG